MSRSKGERNSRNNRWGEKREGKKERKEECIMSNYNRGNNTICFYVSRGTRIQGNAMVLLGTYFETAKHKGNEGTRERNVLLGMLCVVGNAMCCWERNVLLGMICVVGNDMVLVPVSI